VSLSGITLGDYYYDGLNRRIRDLSATGTDFYYSEAWQLLSERNGPSASDKTLREYVWGLQYIDEILERDEDKNSDGDTRDAGDESLYYVQDGNWNVHSICDENGDPVERVLYDPYGLPSFFDGSWGTRSSSAFSNRVLFTGRLWSAASYSYDYRNREQSPYLGRFLQRDPIGVWGDPTAFGNGYGYAGASPIGRLDPSGEYVCICKEEASAIRDFLAECKIRLKRIDAKCCCESKRCKAYTLDVDWYMASGLGMDWFRAMSRILYMLQREDVGFCIDHNQRTLSCDWPTRSENEEHQLNPKACRKEAGGVLHGQTRDQCSLTVHVIAEAYHNRPWDATNCEQLDGNRPLLTIWPHFPDRP
jgi:RHS repeat-associated protein